VVKRQGCDIHHPPSTRLKLGRAISVLTVCAFAVCKRGGIHAYIFVKSVSYIYIYFVFFEKKEGGDTPRKGRFLSVKITNKMQPIIEFIIPKFTEGSAFFERHIAHHQEFQTVFAASGLYTHVVTGRPAWTTAGYHMGI
jgi:hypothetical protein